MDSDDAANGWDGEAIRGLRDRLGLSQERLASRLDVTWSSVSRWENGHAKPSRLACRALDALAKEGAAS